MPKNHPRVKRELRLNVKHLLNMVFESTTEVFELSGLRVIQ